MEKQAQALESLKRLQEAGRTAIRAKDLSRTHREILLKNGFIQMVMKGWYIPGRQAKLPRLVLTLGESPTVISG